MIGTPAQLEQLLDSKKDVLLRSINDYELGELLESGFAEFKFHTGTGYERFFGNMVARHARLRSGTIVVYTLKPSDLETYFGGDPIIRCVKDFSAPVEVFNISGNTVEDLRRHARFS